MLPDTDESPLFGSGFSFLKAPSAKEWESDISISICDDDADDGDEGWNRKF